MTFHSKPQHHMCHLSVEHLLIVTNIYYQQNQSFHYEGDTGECRNLECTTGCFCICSFSQLHPLQG